MAKPSVSEQEQVAVTVNAQEFHKVYTEKGGQMIDVRTAEEVAGGFIPGAVNIPRGQLELRVNEALPDPTQRILVYCELGKISTLAAAMLQDMGYRRAIALDGGIRMWKEANYPLKTAAH